MHKLYRGSFIPWLQVCLSHANSSPVYKPRQNQAKIAVQDSVHLYPAVKFDSSIIIWPRSDFSLNDLENAFVSGRTGNRKGKQHKAKLTSVLNAESYYWICILHSQDKTLDYTQTRKIKHHPPVLQKPLEHCASNLWQSEAPRLVHSYEFICSLVPRLCEGLKQNCIHLPPPPQV